MVVRPGWLVLMLIATATARPLSQAGGAPADDRSVWSGVYTAGQAERGREAYEASCARCHGADLQGRADNRALIGDRFWQDWGEDSLATLFGVVQKTMPRGASGSLAEPVYLDILAYILKKNDYPEGARERDAVNFHGVRVIRKEGPGPVPNFSLVWVVGCLIEESKDHWVLTSASEPLKTRNPAVSEGAERERSAAAALGAHRFDLMENNGRPSLAGRKLEVKGLLIRGTRERPDKLNVTSMQPLTDTCP
jgi:S-disulfanyl-L-cysteine oxidoreductase SoxD